MTNIRPLPDRVIVKRTEEAQQPRGGIIIIPTAKEKPQGGYESVQSCGLDTLLVPVIDTSPYRTRTPNALDNPSCLGES
jgi:hypothetical protein